MKICPRFFSNLHTYLFVFFGLIWARPPVVRSGHWSLSLSLSLSGSWSWRGHLHSTRTLTSEPGPVWGWAPPTSDHQPGAITDIIYFASNRNFWHRQATKFGQREKKVDNLETKVKVSDLLLMRILRKFRKYSSCDTHLIFFSDICGTLGHSALPCLLEGNVLGAGGQRQTGALSPHPHNRGLGGSSGNMLPPPGFLRGPSLVKQDKIQRGGGRVKQRLDFLTSG